MRRVAPTPTANPTTTTITSRRLRVGIRIGRSPSGACLPALVRSRYTAGWPEGSGELTGWQARWRKIHPAGAMQVDNGGHDRSDRSLARRARGSRPRRCPQIDRLVDVLSDALDPNPDGAGCGRARLDQELVARHQARSRAEACKPSLRAGDGRRCHRPSLRHPGRPVQRPVGGGTGTVRYVSRGGHKLDHAIEEFDVEAAGRGPWCRGLHRRLHPLPAEARRRGGSGARRRPRPIGIATGIRPEGDGARPNQPPPALTPLPRWTFRPDRRRPLLYLDLRGLPRSGIAEGSCTSSCRWSSLSSNWTGAARARLAWSSWRALGAGGSARSRVSRMPPVSARWRSSTAVARRAGPTGSSSTSPHLGPASLRRRG